MELKNLTDISTIIDKIDSVTLVVQQINKKSDISNNDLLNHHMENLRQIYNSIQEDLSKINDPYEYNFQKLREQLKILFDNLINVIDFQAEKLIKLEEKVTDLEAEKQLSERRLADLEKQQKIMEKKQKIVEKIKLIGDLLDPLLKVINSPTLPVRITENLLASSSRERTLKNNHC